ncbi:MAG: hypothetical protein GX454_05945 [Brooklawnia sp.]|nr:hypothetical protein [Brooklawnia sp.]
MDELIRRPLVRPGMRSIASTDHRWLFPGRHRVTETFRGHLVAVGVSLGRSRRAAMFTFGFTLAGQVPAPVLAELIGIADKTTTKWAALTTRNWSVYVTQRDSGRSPPMAPNQGTSSTSFYVRRP